MPDLRVVGAASPTPETSSKAKGRWEQWRGGRCWVSADGKSRTYYIRQTVKVKVPVEQNGTVVTEEIPRRIEVRTPATTEDAALEHLRRFQMDPTGYDPAGTRRLEPVYLTADLADEFLKWSALPKESGGAGNTPRWVGEQRRYLAWWGTQLTDKRPTVNFRNRDLLRARMDAALKTSTGYPQRLAVLKKFCSWLRTSKNVLASADDATLDVPIPQAGKTPKDREKAVARKVVFAAMKKLTPRWRDLLTVLIGTGMHVSELERFAAHGTVKKLARSGKAEGAAGAVAIPSTKDGDPLNVAVSKRVLAAARRALDAGSFDRQKLAVAVKDACIAAEVEPFGPGQMRHTVATWAIDSGSDPSAVSAFLNHKSPRTTRKFYARHATPRKVKTMV